MELWGSVHLAIQYQVPLDVFSSIVLELKKTPWSTYGLLPAPVESFNGTYDKPHLSDTILLYGTLAHSQPFIYHNPTNHLWLIQNCHGPKSAASGYNSLDASPDRKVLTGVWNIARVENCPSSAMRNHSVFSLAAETWDVLKDFSLQSIDCLLDTTCI